MKKSPLKFDQIGYWSEMKLEIVKDYAKAYSKILSKQRNFTHVYIDGFAGAGIHLSKTTGTFVPGSPLNALRVEPAFRQYYFIDLDKKKAEALRKLTAGRHDVHVFEGDCNEILLSEIFPQVRFEDFRRGLCLLDPYGLHLNWEVMATAGRMRSIDMFLNFPVMDMNRNALWRNPEKVDQAGVARMNAFWGDDSWRRTAYTTITGLFGNIDEKEPNEAIAAAFRRRLIEVAEFKNVPEPLPMRNTKGAVVYYLFFASPNRTANKIIKHIFTTYRS